MNGYLHEVLYQIGLWWCILITLPGCVWLLWDVIKRPCKRLLVWGVLKLDRAIKRAEMRRIRREKANIFHLEPIYGTRGYRIKTR